MELLIKIKKAFVIAETYMLGLALVALFLVGTNHPVAIRFNYKFEPTYFAPAIIAVFILPVLMAFVYYMSIREPDKFNETAYKLYCFILIFIVVAQTLVCLYSI